MDNYDDDDTFELAPEDFAALPEEGWSLATVAGVWKGDAAVSGARVIRVKFHLTNAQGEPCSAWDTFAVETTSPQGREVARQRFAGLLALVGLAAEPGRRIALSDLVGRALRIEVRLEKFRGRPRARVVNYAPSRGGDGGSEHGTTIGYAVGHSTTTVGPVEAPPDQPKVAVQEQPGDGT